MGDEPGADRVGFFIAGDALRAFASIAVLVFHADIATVFAVGEGADPVHAYALVGPSFIRLNAGLYVFFALSGYLVGGPYVRAWVHGGRYPDLRRYVGRRLRRIVPGFWVVMTLLLLWFGSGGASAAQIAALYAFNQIWDPGSLDLLMPQGWTLDVEMSFYVLLPLLALLAARLGTGRGTPGGRRLVLFALLALGAAGSLWLRSVSAADSGTGSCLAALFWAFTPGLVLAAIEQDARRALAGTGRGRALGLGLAAVAVASFIVIVAGARDDGTLVTELLYLGVGGGLVAGALVWQWATGRGPRGTDSRVAHALGRWSYGIYLVHVGIGLFLLDHRPGRWDDDPELQLLFVAGGMLVLSTIAAALLWWLVEEPFIERRRPSLRRRPRVTGPPRPPVEELTPLRERAPA